MSTTIEQIRKVNVYEEDKNGNRTLVQGDVPLGSNVVMENEVPENKELKLLVGEKDIEANEIKLYPTSITVSSDGTINAKDFLIDNNNIKGEFVSNVYWGEDSSTTPPVRRLYYKINDNSFQVKNSGGTNALNLLQVPYLELYSTNTIKTTDSTNPLYLNVDNVTSTHLPKNTKVVLGHTAIKDSSLDLIDNGRNYLGARLGIDMREDYLYGYLNFYKTVKDGEKTKNYEIGSIFASGDNSFCIMPRKIYYENINKPETNKDGSLKETLPVIAGSVGTSQHKFKDMWAENLHGILQGKIHIPSYTNKDDADKNDTWLEKLGEQYQIFYVGGDFVKSINDMPNKNITDGFCITLSTEGKGFEKQIFIRGGTPGLVTEKYIYIRTYRSGNKKYGPWSLNLGGSSWHNLTIPTGNNLVLITINGKNYYKPAKNATPYLIFNREYLDIYQNNKQSQTTLGLSWNTIYKALNDRTDKEKENNVCIKKQYKRYNSSSKFDLFFGYNDQNQICLWGAASDITSIYLSIKQYD